MKNSLRRWALPGVVLCSLSLILPATASTATTAQASSAVGPAGTSSAATVQAREVQEATRISRLDPSNDVCDPTTCDHTDFPQPRIKAIDLRSAVYTSLQDTERVTMRATVRDLTNRKAEGIVTSTLGLGFINAAGQRDGVSVRARVGSKAVYWTPDRLNQPSRTAICEGAVFTWSYANDTVAFDVPIRCLPDVERGRAGVNMLFVSTVKNYYAQDHIPAGKVRLRVRPTPEPDPETPPAM